MRRERERVRAKRPKPRPRPEGVASRSELREAFRLAWEKCGHPRRNKRCWKRILRQAWGDV